MSADTAYLMFLMEAITYVCICYHLEHACAGIAFKNGQQSQLRILVMEASTELRGECHPAYNHPLDGANSIEYFREVGPVVSPYIRHIPCIVAKMHIYSFIDFYSVLSIQDLDATM